jgi:hypothetical protein
MRRAKTGAGFANQAVKRMPLIGGAPQITACEGTARGHAIFAHAPSFFLRNTIVRVKS